MGNELNVSFRAEPRKTEKTVSCTNNPTLVQSAKDYDPVSGLVIVRNLSRRVEMAAGKQCETQRNTRRQQIHSSRRAAPQQARRYAYHMQHCYTQDVALGRRNKDIYPQTDPSPRR